MDGTTDDERALIDAAVAAGAVTKVPSDDTPQWQRNYEKQRVKIAARRKKVAEMVGRGMSAKEIAKALQISLSTVVADRSALGLKGKGRKGRKPSAPGAQTKSKIRERRAQSGAERIRDRRRFKHQPVPMGQPAKMAPKESTGTIFPTRVFPVKGDEAVLKDGCNNSKIGGDVQVGFLQGASIWTLTLEERATCPTSCQLWQGCYGNTMQHARRWRHGGSLEAELDDELRTICSGGDLVLIRLHILGDFYSPEYVVKWAEWLDEYPNLHIFGFTAWREDTKIGKAVDWLRQRAGRRFMVRTSGRTGRFGSFTLPFPTEVKMIGDAIVCPEQLDAMLGSPEGKHCGNCAACWSCDNPIAFVEH